MAQLELPFAYGGPPLRGVMRATPEDFFVDEDQADPADFRTDRGDAARGDDAAVEPARQEAAGADFVGAAPVGGGLVPARLGGEPQVGRKILGQEAVDDEGHAQ